MPTPTLPRKIIINNSIYFVPLSRSLFLRATGEPNIDTEVFARSVQASSFSFLYKRALTSLLFDRIHVFFLVFLHKILRTCFWLCVNRRAKYVSLTAKLLLKKKKYRKNPLHKHVLILSGDDKRLEIFHESLWLSLYSRPLLLQWIIHSNAMLFRTRTVKLQLSRADLFENVSPFKRKYILAPASTTVHLPKRLNSCSVVRLSRAFAWRRHRVSAGD